MSPSSDHDPGDAFDGAGESVLLTLIHPVANYDTWIAHIRDRLPTMADRGVLRLRVLRAVDDPNEVLVALDMRSREHAERIMFQDEGVQRAMEIAGISIYPAVFIGRLAERFDVTEGLPPD